MTLLERVARAILEAHRGHDEFDLDDCCKMARAAIEAMREPTPWMLAHGDVVVPSGFLWKRDSVEISGTQEIYTAMIDSALNEK